MEKIISRITVVFVVFVVVLSFLLPPAKRLHNLHERSFDALQSTTLFFTNTRAFYYDAEEMPEAGINIYRFGETLKTDTGAYLNFSLVHNWRTSQVYVITEPSADFLNLGEQTVWVGDTSFTFNKTAMNYEAQYDFAAYVYEALLAKKTVTYGAKKQNLFGTNNNQAANLTVLEDYFRWVYKYR
jgi:hypothetical protein